MELPPRFPARAVPEIFLTVSSAWVSSSRDQEVRSSVTLDVYQIYENSPDTSYYFTATSPVTPPFSEGTLPLLGPASHPREAPASLDSFLVYDITFLDCDADLLQHAVPLLPLSGDLQLLPDTALERHPVSARHPSPPEASSLVIYPPRDLSREGPFDDSCAASDTGDPPFVSEGLPGCPYLMTSYDSADVANVDPAYGLQLHHLRILEFVGAPESARLLGPGTLGSGYGQGRRNHCSIAAPI